MNKRIKLKFDDINLRWICLYDNEILQSLRERELLGLILYELKKKNKRR